MNSKFGIADLEIQGLKMITPFCVEDDRGYFLKDFEQNVFAEFGITKPLSECFVTRSKKGVIRGMHFQIKDPQIKLVSALQGEILDVAVDLRRDSDTFGKWQSVILSENNHKIFYIPAGFAHGFQVLSDSALVSYKCIGDYDAQTDSGIAYNDEELGITWLTGYEVIVSQRDKDLMTFNDFKKMYGGLAM